METSSNTTKGITKMNYKALNNIRTRVELAQSKGAINASEAMTLIHHMQVGSRYASTKTKCLAAEIAKKVRLSAATSVA